MNDEHFDTPSSEDSGDEETRAYWEPPALAMPGAGGGRDASAPLPSFYINTWRETMTEPYNCIYKPAPLRTLEQAYDSLEKIGRGTFGQVHAPLPPSPLGSGPGC